MIIKDHRLLTLGARIRFARAIHTPPLTQKDLREALQAKSVYMSPAVLSKIEHNQRKLRIEEIVPFAKVLDVSCDWLLGIKTEFERLSE